MSMAICPYEMQIHIFLSISGQIRMQILFCNFGLDANTAGKLNTEGCLDFCVD